MKSKLTRLLILWGVVALAFAPAGLTGQNGRDVEVTASISADKIGIDDVLRL